MKKVLVVYYSQSGQLKDIIDSTLTPLKEADHVSIEYEEIKPKKPYPYPWKSTFEFCNSFPESIAETPCELEPFNFDPNGDYDLIIIGYTIWYLVPSIPITSFLKSPEAVELIKDKPVVTIMGCRNMWLLAQERVKEQVYHMGGRIAGNIVLADRAYNLVGIFTIWYWLVTGKKERLLKLFPKPGVSDKDIKAAVRFGKPILESLKEENFNLDQSALNKMGAAIVYPTLIIFENRMIKIFRIWSKFILAKGGPENPNRRFRVRMFLYYLLTAIFVLAPLAAVLSVIIRLIKKKKLREKVEYYSQNSFKK